MEKRIVQSLLAASVLLFAWAIGLAAFARPAADTVIAVAGRGSAGLAVGGLAMFVAFKVAGNRRLR